MSKMKFLTGLLILSFVLAVVSPAGAVAPNPKAIQKMIDNGTWDQKVANWKAFKANGGCAPEEHSVFNKKLHEQRMAAGVEDVQIANVIVILVDFDDNPMSAGVNTTPAMFDSLLFSNRDSAGPVNTTGSMTDYYLEVSYNQFYIKGDIYGPYRMPKTYAYYVGNDDGLSNGRVLALDAVLAAEAAGADFSKYDVDENGECDGVIVIHAGRGAEEGVYGIHSHKSNFTTQVFDGVSVSAYTMTPEESFNQISPIGVFCHEYGHFLGLPDLYDVDYTPSTSDGLGEWSLMASGNYLGNSTSPAHMDAWCKASVGFLSYTPVYSNELNVEIPNSENNPIAYLLSNGFTGSEYYVVENRQKLGFDQYLPGEGLMIYHVDLNAPANNTNYLRYYVGLEQADGKNDLALKENNTGDVGDPWPGSSGNRNFHDYSVPDAILNTGTPSRIGVWNVSNSADTMYAEFNIGYSRPWPVFTGIDSIMIVDAPPKGNGDGVYKAGDTVSVFMTVKNLMKNSYNLRAHLTTSNPELALVADSISFNADLDETPRSNTDPLLFAIPDSVDPSIDTIYITFVSDSLPGIPGSANYEKTYAFEVMINPQVLVVDDDGGSDFEQYVADKIYDNGMPYGYWEKDTQGVPPLSTLEGYRMAFWHTGAQHGGSLLASDCSTLKQYLDGGGSLFISGFSVANDAAANDPAFLSNYLHAGLTGDSVHAVGFLGLADNDITHDQKYYLSNLGDFTDPKVLTAINGGEVAFVAETATDKVVAVSYSGAYKTLLMTFPFEYIRDNRTGYQPKDSLIERVVTYFVSSALGIFDGTPFAALPDGFELNQNYPNPFNPTTTISYTIRPRSDGRRPAEEVNLSIFNTLGQKVKTLVDDIQRPGEYKVEWSGNNDNGDKVATGVYFYRLTMGDERLVKKMVLLK